MDDRLFAKYRGMAPSKSRKTERGEYLDFFLGRLNPGRIEKGLPPLTYARIQRELQGIETKDLFHLRRKMLDAEKRGFPVGVVFWTEIRPEK